MWGTGGRMDGWEPDLSPKMELGSSRGGASTGQGLTIKLEKSRINPCLGRMRSPGAVKVLFWSSPLTCRSRQLRPSFTIFVVKHRS